MTKCLVCNEQTFGDRTGLCYLHRKYAARITGPYFETLYDLLYWKATFLKEWDAKELGKIAVSCAPHVEVMKENKETVQVVKDRIHEQLKLTKADLSMYIPLVRTLSYAFAVYDKLTFEEIYNEGMLHLKVLECRIEKGLNPKIISAWVKKSLVGRISKVTLYDGIVKNKQTNNNRRDMEVNSVGFADWHIKDDQSPTAEDMVMEIQEKQQQVQAIGELSQKLNPLQRRLLANMFKDNPRTQKQLATANKIAQGTVSKAITVIYRKAKELGYDTTCNI